MRPNPVSAASAGTYILKMHPDDPEQQEEYLKAAEAEQVVAIGWGVGRNPLDPRLTADEHRSLIAEDYPADDSDYAIGRIRAFMDLPPSARLLIITGYPPNQRKPVPVHAIGRLHKKRGYQHQAGAWWFEHQRPLSAFRRYRNARVPTSVFHSIQGSMMRVLHGPYTEDQMQPVLEALAGEGFDTQV